MADLILGSSGMMGRALARVLPDARLTTRDNWDLTDDDNTSFVLLNRRELDTVYFAAGLVGGIEENMAHPVEFLDQNIRIGLNSLRFAFQAGARHFVNISSVCAFPPSQGLVGPQDLWSGRPAETNASYGIAKRVIAEAAAAWRRQYNFDTQTIFLPNLFGDAPRKDPKKLHVIPAIIEKVRRAIENNEDVVELRGSGFEQREFMHVDDAAKAVVEITNDSLGVLGSTTYGTKPMVTAGTGQVIAIREIAEAVREAFNWSGRFLFDRAKPSGQDFRAMALDFKTPEHLDFKEQIKRMVNEDGQRAEATEKPRSVHEPVRASQSVGAAAP